ncbi:hypothetical protein [Bacillus sp. FJAT-45350]|uniref:hypothetical protein n=1 Tax=Bacillus sp. FJAT-45350 TaxID=2011014 RepID=UPI000BB8F86A|nr:hypothetical protein [Bacillus sp. FJAT-45350]
MEEKMLQQILATVQAVQSSTVQLQKDVSQLQTSVTQLKEDVGVLKEDVGVLKEDVSVLKGDMSMLQEDVNVLKTDVSALKGDVKALDLRVGNLEAGQKELNEITRGIRDRQEDSDAKLEAISMDVHHLHGKVESGNEKLQTIHEDHKSMIELIGEHEISIRSLRRRPV